MFKKFLAFFAALYMTVSFAAVDVNKAAPADLDSVKGIGPAISSKIVDERKKGEFKDWNNFIERVPGIGSKNAVRFSAEGLTVGGASYNGEAPAAKKESKTSAAKSEEKKADAKSTAPANAATPVKDTKKTAADAKSASTKPAASTVKN